MPLARGKILSVPFFAGCLIAFSGCAALFGWQIHAPGLLSQNYYERVAPLPSSRAARIGLYLPEEVLQYQSKNRGGRLADPQTYFAGEAFTPMVIEAFQQGFEEFIFFEAEPNPLILEHYGITHLAVVQIRALKNRVTLKGQALQLETETRIYDRSLKPVAAFESLGASDAQKVFAKKGGPEVNLNAAIENNVLAIVQYLQDWLEKSDKQ